MKQGIGMKLWRIIYPFIIWFASQLAVQSAIVAIYTVSQIFKTGGEFDGGFALYESVLEYIDANILLLTLVSNIASAAILFVFYFLDKRKYKGNPIDEKQKFSVLGAITVLFGSAGMCIVLNLMITIAAAIAVLIFGEGIMDAYNEVSDSIRSSSYILQFLAVVISAPLLEELLIRGLVFKRLRQYLGFWSAALISAVIFGAIHGNWVQFIFATVIGVVLAYYYELSHNLVIPMIMHGGINLISFLMGTDGLSGAYEKLISEYFFPTVSVFLLLCVSGLWAAKAYFEKNRQRSLE